MLIDWFTVVAQIVNFLILVALLKHFLYDRIIRAMDKREEKIRSRLQAAEEERKKAHEEAESYRRKNEEIENTRERMLDEAKEEADRKRKELTHKAREEVNQARQRWHQSVEKEKNAFLQDLRRMTVREVHAISRRALEDLADVDLEERLVDVFISRFNQLEKDKKDAILRGIREENKVGIRSGFELSSGSRRKIMKMLKEEGFQEIDATYETDPRVTMGIEVKSRGEKVAWSIRDYIAALEDRANAAIERQIQQADEAPKPSAETETAAERDPEHKRTSKTNGGKTASVQETRE